MKFEKRSNLATYARYLWLPKRKACKLARWKKSFERLYRRKPISRYCYDEYLIGRLAKIMLKEK